MALPTTAASANSADLAHVLGVRDAEAERRWAVRVRRRRVDDATASSESERLGAGDTDARDGVDEALRVLGDGLEAVVGQVGAARKMGARLFGAHRVEVVGRLLRR